MDTKGTETTPMSYRHSKYEYLPTLVLLHTETDLVNHLCPRYSLLL